MDVQENVWGDRLRAERDPTDDLYSDNFDAVPTY